MSCKNTEIKALAGTKVHGEQLIHGNHSSSAEIYNKIMAQQKSIIKQNVIVSAHQSNLTNFSYRSQNNRLQAHGSSRYF